jgi:E3 ubiquitin-protein ligase ZNF598
MAALAEDEHCAICADTLAWVAYGRCGHREACSKCVLRMRAVLRDTRCPICQQPCDAVVVTRAAGAYTRVLPPDAFDDLKVRVS